MMDTIPSKFIGRLVGLIKLEYLQFEEAIKTPPKIEFSWSTVLNKTKQMAILVIASSNRKPGP